MAYIAIPVRHNNVDLNSAADVNQLHENIEYVSNSVNGEALARDAADDVLQGNINSEASARSTADGTLQGNINNHVNATTGVHGATSEATSDKLAIRDSAGRFKVAQPSVNADVANKEYVDTKVASAGGGNLSTNDTSATDGEIVVTDGTTGKLHKKSGKLIGNASGNISPNNGIKCANLYAEKSGFIREVAYAGADVLAYCQQVAAAMKYGQTEFYVGYNASGINLPSADVDNWTYRLVTALDGAAIHVEARKNNINTDLARWENKYSTESGWKGWTKLTDANGNAMNALSLGGTLAANYALKTDGPAYDLIIDSDEKLAAWAASGTYAKVLIKAGTWTLASGGVDLTARGTKSVTGEAGSLLVFSSASMAMSYSAVPTTPEYSMTGVNISASGGVGFRRINNITRCKSTGSRMGFLSCVNVIDCSGSGASSTADFAIGFYECVNVVNCDGIGVASAHTGYGFANCSLVTNCNGRGTGTGSGKIGAGFSACTMVTNCEGHGTGNSGGVGAGFSACMRVMNCVAEGTGYSGGVGYGYSNCKKTVGNIAPAYTTAKYYISYADEGTAAACADTAAGGWNS